MSAICFCMHWVYHRWCSKFIVCDSHSAFNFRSGRRGRSNHRLFISGNLRHWSTVACTHNPQKDIARFNNVSFSPTSIYFELQFLIIFSLLIESFVFIFRKFYSIQILIIFDKMIKSNKFSLRLVYFKNFNFSKLNRNVLRIIKSHHSWRKNTSNFHASSPSLTPTPTYLQRSTYYLFGS